MMSDGGGNISNVIDSVFYKTGGAPLGRAKPRDFNINPKTLTIINAQHYDKIEDMG